VSINLLEIDQITARGVGLLPETSRLDSTFTLDRGQRYSSPPNFVPLLDGRASFEASIERPVLIAIYVAVDNPTVMVDAAALIVTGDALGRLQGDYDGDDVVYADDYKLWRDTFGSTVDPGTGADGDGNGKIEVADYVVWRTGFGASIRPTDAYLAGDYDYDGHVDADDYFYWKSEFGNHVAPFSGADGDGDGLVNARDYTIWRNQFGTSLPGAAFAAVAPVPEPATFCLIVIAVSVLPAIRPLRRGL
jgi:hypothetical protein